MTTPSTIASTHTEENKDANIESLKDLFTSVELPCGRTLSNRLVKVALYEHMASFNGGPPNPNHLSLYAHWSRGNWGMIITGNCQVAPDHLTLGRDLVVPTALTEYAVQPYTKLASAIHHGEDAPIDGFAFKETAGKGQPLAIIQLSHTGRQSPNFLGGRSPFVSPLAPSAVPLKLSGGTVQGPASIGQILSRALSTLLHQLIFLTPREMTEADINGVVDAFVKGAHLAVKSGFDGVEVHAAHGYLLAQFVSPETNIRTDEFSATSNPLRLIHEIVSAIRSSGSIPSDFVVGIKLNAADYVAKTSTTSDGINDTADEERVLAHVREIATWKMIDFIEVSGGNYESPNFMDVSPTSRRQALFSRFSHQALTELSKCDGKRPLVLLTGGLVSPALLGSVLKEKHGDLVGVGRLSVFQPELPRLLEQAVSTGRTSYLTGLENGPLATGKTSDDALYGKPEIGWSIQVEQVFTQVLASLWALVPLDARPQFPKIIGAGAEMARYDVAMRNIATESQANIGGDLGAMVRLWAYISPSLDATSDWTVWVALSAIAVLTVAYLALFCRG